MEEEIPKQISEVEESNKFKYSDCQIRSRTEIRILNLLPPINSNPDALHCTLSVAKPEDKPLYEAVSYVWGPPVFPERLHLPSGYLNITTNLAAALRQFRYPDRQRQLWVDAVCINQQNDIEKGHQVQLMSQLYRNTERALVWLGEEYSNTQAIFGLLERFAAEHQLFGINRDDSFFEVFQKLRVLFPEDEAESEIPHFAHSISPSIINLLQVSWFERLWVIQEAVLPGKVQVFWGHETLNLDTLILAMKVYLALARKSSTIEFSNIWVPLIFLSDLRENFHSILTGHGGNKTRIIECNLFDIVANFSPLKACYNDMDRIFGLLGLQSNDDFGFEVNYEGTVESVYFEFALKALESIDLENFLQEAFRIRDSTSHLREGIPVRLPSWVPDWRCTKSGGRLSLERFQSATTLPECLSYEKETLPFIRLGGVRVDIIADDLSTIFPDRDDLHSLEDIWKSHPARLINLKDFLLKHLPTDKSLPIEDATKNFVGTILSEMAFVGSLQGIPQVENGLEGLYTWWMNFENAHAKKTDSSNIPVNLGSLKMPRESFRRSGNFVITKTGHMGTGPLLVKRGDIVAIFDGLRTPIVLRPVLPDQPSRPPMYSPNKEQVFVPDEQWELLGECYLHGFMNNEVAEPQWREKSEMFWIT
ncbi:uncharacterized protein EAE98_003658 [Botrytis deweyae]|uniref:Heterokaryon incompatibility domain-containing protein n=1 Tax=Botrytis deweyae TaxID=2478750 RepID=A0ABQ7IU62_9HELO|nr:uncharacterized protein EAE98_003658 [Botrytis deweyae]KAF7933949.1 hypothetical protein EAE98_003658 [Botrytis deweyae]